MVVLQKNHIEQTDTVVLATADLHCHFVQHAHTGCGLTGIQHFGFQTLQAIGIDRRLSRHATHSLHNIEQDTLGLQQRLQTTRHVERHVAHLHASTIFEQLLELHLGIQTVEYHLRNLDTCNDTLLLAQQAHTTALLGRNAAERGVITIANILFNSKFDQLFNEGNVFSFHSFI